MTRSARDQRGTFGAFPSGICLRHPQIRPSTFDFRPSTFDLRLLTAFTSIHLWLLLTFAHAAPVIRHITIEGNTRTRTEIIYRELLFESGQTLDTLKIAETERNLRRLFFLGNIHIHIRQDNTHADLTVRVQDLYARALSPLLSGNIDELSYGLTALDFNLFGRGQIARLTLFHDAITGNSARFL